MSKLYLCTSAEGLIEKVVNLSMDQEWFDAVVWDGYLGKHWREVIEMSKITEIHGKCFLSEPMSIEGKSFVFLNQEPYFKSLYKNALNCISEGLQVFDRNGYLIYANEASERLEHYRFEDYKDKHLLDLYDLSEDYSTTLTVLRTGQPILNRCDRFITKDKKELVTINSGYPLKDKGELLGACVFESDMTTIKHTENRLFNLEHFIRTNSSECKQVRYSFKDIVHASKVMQDRIKYAKKAALSEASILIVGETGTGKELIAQSIHDYSKRYAKPFVDVNCGALPSNLVESLFFGTEKGAFTGSVDKKGLFEMASGGTLFLDEVNAMDYDIQAKLLRVIQEKRYQRVGGSAYHQCDVRLIASINEDPKSLMADHRLRKDFYYRIANMVIEMPPLRERTEDIPALSSYFLSKFSRENGQEGIDVSEEVIETLMRYQWPGNVRELEHAITSAAHHLSANEMCLTLQHLPSYFHDKGEMPQRASEEQALSRALLDYERKYIEKVLKQKSGNVTQAAKSLGISRQNLQYRIKKHQL